MAVYNSDKPRDVTSLSPEAAAIAVVTPKPLCVGVGMPAAMLLDEFGNQVWNAFGQPPYLVGSALTGKIWRDVDVRLILWDDAYEALGLGKPRDCQRNPKWVSLCLAYSTLGKSITGLPIDFQIQQMTAANEEYNGPRSALGMVPLRWQELLNRTEVDADGEA